MSSGSWRTRRAPGCPRTAQAGAHSCHGFGSDEMVFDGCCGVVVNSMWSRQEAGRGCCSSTQTNPAETDSTELSSSDNQAC
jgi:hypothetical protein